MLSITAVSSRGDQLKKIGLAFVVCSVTVAVCVLTRHEDVQLTMELSSSVRSTAQVFFDNGAGYREVDSRTAAVDSTSLGDFRALTFQVPGGIESLRFDPLMTTGRFIVRDVHLRARHASVPIDPRQLTVGNQIASRIVAGGGVAFSTTPGANDPILLFDAAVTSELNHLSGRRGVLLFLIWMAALTVIATVAVLLYEPISSGRLVWAKLRTVHARFDAAAKRLSAPGFIPFDSYALWFYAACGVMFLAASLADLNGSSSGMYSSVYGHGARTRPLIGKPRAVRSDEWAYLTPDMLNQSLRADRFKTSNSEIGNHSVSLTGNIPVWHISTLFRPQFWPFFVLRVDYAYAFNWQFKGFILLTGVFTWLLLITGSTAWAITGSLWFFFSPFTQWSYSWPSALPEMIGSICLAVVLACFLTIGRNGMALALGSAGLALCCINFAMCAYPPHLIPLFWLAVFFCAAWCVSHRELIFTRTAVGRRAAALGMAAVVIGAIGALLFSELREAIVAVSNTAYPGKRAFAAGTYPIFELGSHFLQWTENEQRIPAVLGNICEGSGFLWLAPVTLLCLHRMRLSPAQKAYCASLWLALCFLLAWLVLPVPARLGALFGLQETGGARILPAVGLGNIGIVTLCMASLRDVKRSEAVRWLRWAGCAALGWVVMLIALRATNQRLGLFFSQREVALAALAAGILVSFIVSARKLALALALIVPQAALFGWVNPVERGLPAFTSSGLYVFVRHHPELLQGKWLAFSDSVVNSGFIAATGCDVYTGLRYLPDIDHSGLFAAYHYDVQALNRSGFLTAHLRKGDEPSRIEVPLPHIAQWDVSPADPIVKELGIKYFAFDQPIPPALGPDLIALSPGAVDGFWLYRLR